MTRTRQILFIQGGGAGAHDEWDDKLVESLRQELGGGYEVRYPRMPDEGDQAHLRSVMAEYRKHYNTARPHQAIGQRVPDTEHHAPRIIATDFDTRQIRRKPVLSGLINEYTRAA